MKEIFEQLRIFGNTEISTDFLKSLHFRLSYKNTWFNDDWIIFVDMDDFKDKTTIDLAEYIVCEYIKDLEERFLGDDW